MAVLVALAGAGIGSLFGATGTGFSIGSALGAALFPTKSQDPAPPQIGDISISSSAYGAVMPRPWGTVRLAGQYIWAYRNQMQVETETTSVGGGLLGKGGQSASTSDVKYFMTAMLSFGQGVAKDVLRIWGDGKLIYDKVSVRRKWMGGLNLRFYSGAPDQLPDPWIEKDHGVGNVPAYRGQVCLFLNMPLANFGNRPPSITAEIAFAATESQPLVPANLAGGAPGCMSIDWRSRKLYSFSQFSGTNWFQVYDLDTMSLLQTVPETAVGPHDYFFTGGPASAIGPNGMYYTTVKTGNFAGGLAKIDPVVWKEVGFYNGVSWPRETLFTQAIGPTGTRTFVMCLASTNIFLDRQITVLDADTLALVYVENTGGTNYYMGTPGKVAPDHGEIWMLQDATHLHLMTISLDAFWDAAAGHSNGASHDLAYTLTEADVVAGATGLAITNMAYDPTDDTLMMSIGTANKGAFVMKWSPVAGVLFCEPVPYGPEAQDSYGADLYSKNSRISYGAYAYFTRGPDANQGANDRILKVSTATGAVISNQQWHADNWGNFYSGTIAYDGETDSVIFWNRQNNNPWGNAQPTGFARAYIDRAAGAGVPLSQIVTDICRDVGVQPADLDVSELTDSVRGYTLGRVVTGQDALLQLNGAYFFDAVESDWKIKFPKRPQPLGVTIPEDDLIVVDSKTGNLMNEPIRQDAELPVEADVAFLNWEHDHQPDSKSWRRPVAPVRTVFSDNVLSQQLAIDMTASEAAQIAQKMVYTAWRERNTYEIALPWSYLALDPSDVAKIAWNDGSSVKLRPTKIDLGLDFSMKVSAVGQGDQTYASQLRQSGDFFTPQPGPGDQDSKLFVLDIPLLRDMDSRGSTGSVVYLAAGPFTLNAWVGCRVYKSSDPTLAGEVVATIVNACSWGSCVTALPDNLQPWGWDRSTVLTVRPIGGPVGFESATEDEVLSHSANALAVFRSDGEAEIIQFVTAVENADGSWSLSQLLRGRRGTDVVCKGHAIGAPYVVLDPLTITPIQVNPAERGQPRYWRAVGFGLFPQDAQTVARPTNARDRQPYMPAQLKAVSTGGGTPSVNVSWVPRTRLHGEWLSGVDAPLSEASELYDLEIYSGPGGTLKRTFADVGAARTVTYSNASIVADFGALPAALTVRLYQKSAVVGRGLTRELTIPVS